jgi:hypothetical protein
MLDGGSRSLYRQGCRILIEMAGAIFSSSWRIPEPYGCAQSLRPLARTKSTMLFAVTTTDFEDWLAGATPSETH